MSASRADDRDTFTVKDAAVGLGISERLVRELIRSGQLVAYRYGPRKIIVYGEELRAFKESRRVEALNKEAG